MTETVCEWLSLPDLVKRYKLPASWWYSQVKQETIPFYKVGKYLRFKDTEIEAWVEERRRGPQQLATGTGLVGL